MGTHIGPNVDWNVMTAEEAEALAAGLAEADRETPKTDGRASVKRPGTPQQVRSWLQRKAALFAAQGKTATPGQRGAMIGALEALFPSEPRDMRTQCRYSLLRYVYGVDSSKKLTDAQALALLAWAQARDDMGIPRASDLAIAEAAAIINAAGEAAGQQRLI
ncbi:MAG: hypothetical protein H5T69_04175 [Chloroflexi bacterium]|nr:hypothetical protein [Chloroflexota bacterium]